MSSPPPPVTSACGQGLTLVFSMALSPEFLFHTQTSSNAINRKGKFLTNMKCHIYVQNDSYYTFVRQIKQKGALFFQK